MTTQQASGSRDDGYAKMERLRQAISQTALECDAAAKTWQTQIDEYSALKERLATLDHKLSHEIMVPFGNVAFMPGKLVKTNQVMMLLGDNWFVERSCHQAIEIIDRRINYAKQALTDVESRKKLVLSRLDFSNQIDVPSTSDDGGTVEIKEPYNEAMEYEYEAKKKRVSRVPPVVVADNRNETEPEAPKGVNQKEFQALMKHLDELEQKEEEEEGDSSDESLDSDDLPNSDADDTEAVNVSKKSTEKRHSVTFTDTLEIGPTPSTAPVEPQKIINEDTGFSALPKSILRNKEEKSPVDPAALQKSQEEPPRPVILPMSTEVFTGVISERSVDVGAKDSTTEEQSTKRVSKFKQRKVLQ